ncbi:MAG TPA: transcriptional regulator, partial [Methylocella sp.]|nr:transcriptional regulator [Methylocella sp.]
AYFFEGAPAFEPPSSAAPGQLEAAEEPKAYVADFLSTPEGLHLNMAFARIPDPKIRKRILDLVCALAGEEPESPEPGAGAGDPPA